MTDWTGTLVEASEPIRRAIEIIDSSAFRIALVVDDDRRLLGSATDGDIRRGLLRGTSLDHPISAVMNQSPVSLPIEATREVINQTMNDHVIRQVPMLDAEGHVCGLAHIDFLSGGQEPRNNMVVLMAGGLGSRLRPLTDETPKPMLKVGDKPLLESIVESFIAAGFWKFAISVNYKGNVIKEHFGDGSSRGAQITYLEETEPRGTAGSLKLLDDIPNDDIIVMNGDVLTKVDFGHLLDFHHEMKAAATMAVREYDFQVPYGVVQTENSFITAIDEKPVHLFFVNAGIYVLSRQALDLIPDEGRYDMTTLFSALRERDLPSVAFPIREYWMDIGRYDDLDQARREIKDIN